MDVDGQIYIPITYALNTFGLCFASITAMFAWILLEKRQALADAFRGISLPFSLGRRQVEEPIKPPQIQYKEVPTWWYWVLLSVSLAIAMFTCEFYPVQLRWYGALFAMAVSAVFFVPLAWIYATTNVKIQIDIFCRVVAGYVWEGQVLANIWFFDLGYISGIKGLAFAQDLKLGAYCNVSSYYVAAAQAKASPPHGSADISSRYRR